jgi:hypothetical protein
MLARRFFQFMSRQNAQPFIGDAPQLGQMDQTDIQSATVKVFLNAENTFVRLPRSLLRN